MRDGKIVHCVATECALTGVTASLLAITVGFRQSIEEQASGLNPQVNFTMSRDDARKMAGLLMKVADQPYMPAPQGNA